MLTFGAILVCGALLAFAALTLVFRRPDPPRWTARSGVGETVTILLTASLTFGAAYLLAGALSAHQQGIDAIDLGLAAVVLAATVVTWRRLDVRRRLRAYGATGRAKPAVHIGSTPTPGSPAPRPTQPAGPTHVRAA